MKNDAFKAASSSHVLRASLGGAAALLLVTMLVIACTDLVGPDNATEAPSATAATPQHTAPATQQQEKVFLVVDLMPQFPGGLEALAAFLQKEVKYPVIAKKAGVQGKVFVQFVIGSDGKVSDVEVVRGIGGGCDEEAVRIVEAMPDWIPGKQDGQAVEVRFSMPITFKLDA